jgi:hypothetical protein
MFIVLSAKSCWPLTLIAFSVAYQKAAMAHRALLEYLMLLMTLQLVYRYVHRNASIS